MKRDRERFENPRRRDEVQRSVVERERSSLAGGVENFAGSNRRVPPLDVCRGERAQCTRDLGELQIGELTRLDPRHPLIQPDRHIQSSAQLSSASIRRVIRRDLAQPLGVRTDRIHHSIDWRVKRATYNVLR